MRRTIAAFLLVAVAVAFGPRMGGASAAATTTVNHGLTTVRALIVDPVTGLVFVSGDDSVAVFNPDGTLRATIPGIWGASGMDIDSGSLWVAESTAGKFAKIAIATLSVTQTFTAGMPVGDNLAVVGTSVFFGVPPVCCGWTTGARFDTLTSTTVTFGGYYGAAAKKIPGSTTSVLFYERGISSGTVYKVATSSPYGVISSIWTNGYLGQIAVSADATKFWSATGSPYNFPEWNLTTMTATGVVYPGTAYPRGITYSPAFGGIIAGSAGGSLWISKVGNPITVNQIPVGGEPTQLGLATNGSVAYYVSGSTLVTRTLAPTITAASPSAVVANVPTVISVTGTGLGGTTSATLGGVSASFSAVTPTSIQMSVPNGVIPGAQNLVLAGPFGIASISITVQANTGATLSGTVRSGAIAKPGVTLTVSGGALVTGVSTTSSATGQYAFTGLPYGTTYSLLAHDATSVPTDQTISNITLTPNLTTTVNVDMQAPVVSNTWKLATTTLPGGSVRDMLVESTSGRVFISNGDEVDVVDRSGSLLARIQGIWGANALTTGGGMVYVGSASAARVTQINPSTLAVTGSWPLNTLTNGAIGYAGGKVYFTNGNDQWTSISSLDPVTGLIAASGAGSLYVPQMRSVEGDPNGLLVWEVGITSYADYIYDASGGSLVLKKSAWDVGSPSIASAPSNRLWNAAGREFNLTTLLNTGIQYPGSGPLAHAAGRGSVLAFGASVVRESTPQLSHTLDVIPTQIALEPSADRAFAITSTNQFIVYDLMPRITGTAPSTIYAEPTTITVNGSGLGATTGVNVDGVAVAFIANGPNRLQLTLSSLSAGPHSVEVTTPWGTTAPFAFTAVTRPPPPTVTTLSPAALPTKGGSLTITGTDLTQASAVNFGTVAASSFSVINGTTITALVPPHLAATVAVTVTTPGGTNATSPMFSWVAPLPAITSLTPSQSSPAGGASVTISGMGLSFATAVSFGGTPAVFVPISDTTITATAPAHATGLVNVLVTTAGGTSAPAAGSTFSYALPPPTITAMSPNTGSTSGGYTILIKGTKFTGTTSVRFGLTPSASHLVIDDSTLVAIVPPHAAGIVSVSVTGPAGTNADVFADWFNYQSPATGSLIGSVRSSAGPLGGMTVLVSPANSMAIFASTTSASDGSYAVTGLPAGDYKVLVLDPAIFAGSTAYFIPKWYDGAGASFDKFPLATTIIVNANTTKSLNTTVLSHNQAGSLSGVVMNGAIPLAGMYVVVLPASTASISSYSVTGPDGRFMVPDLAPGGYKIVTVDPAALFGATSYFLPQFYDNAGDSINAFAVAAVIPVPMSQNVATRTIQLRHN